MIGSRIRASHRAAIRNALLVLCALGAAQSAAAQNELAVDPARSEIGFSVSQMGVTVRGGFEQWEADIAIDPEAPANSRARITVRTASIDTGHSDTDREVKKANWLAVERFPEAVFTAGSVERLGDGKWQARGPLRIRDVSRTVTVPFAIDTLDDGSRRMQGDFSIKRADFDVGGGAWGDFDVVANEVQIRFKLVAAP